MEITIKITGIEGLVQAIGQLAQVLGQGNTVPQAPVQPLAAGQQASTPVAPPQVQVPPVATPPVQAPQTSVPPVAMPPVQSQTPTPVVTQQVMPQAPIPTTHVAQSYTQEQIAVAMTSLVDGGKLDVVHGILAAFGVQALTEIPADQYPALALKLREVGANI